MILNTPPLAVMRYGQSTHEVWIAPLYTHFRDKTGGPKLKSHVTPTTPVWRQA